ncbi:MAG: hypothetical protein JSS81_17870 [Acidobacteria bacterium]|nr:hypothetical protein [Acidobacteriota bacterium]
MDTLKTDVKSVHLCRICGLIFEMKTGKLVGLLISSIVLRAPLLACQVAAGSTVIEDNFSRIRNYQWISLFFLLTAAFFYQLKKRRDGLVFLLIGGAALFLSWAISDPLGGDCGTSGIKTSQIGAAVTFICSAAQFITWLLFRRKSRAELF